jgi:hypothetical protein
MAAALTHVTPGVHAVGQSPNIVNHDIMNCTAEGVVANHLYSSRALGITDPADILQLNPLLQPLWPAIRQHYQRIGLAHSEQIIWDLDRKHLGYTAGYEPSVFFFGPHEFSHWRDEDWFEAVNFINSKNNFMKLALELGVDIPQTHCYSSARDIDHDMIRGMSYPCYLKAAISVSGVGIYRCESQDELLNAIDRFAADIPVQLQEEVVTDSFLNMQYRVSENGLERLTASEQILDGFAHQGNRVPASHEPWEAIEPMAIWLYEKGIRGIFAFDVAVVETPQGTRFPAIECNPRYNGASYPTLIAEKLGIGQWSAVTLSTQYRDLAEIDLQGIEYSCRSGSGVILVNWGTVLEGKLMVLLAGTISQQQALEVALRKRL